MDQQRSPDRLCAEIELQEVGGVADPLVILNAYGELIYTLPLVGVHRSGITYPTEQEQAAIGAAPAPLAGVDQAHDGDAAVIASHGWCPPSELLSGQLLSPEARAQVEYETRPCNSVHRWERWVDRPQCGCTQCDYTERHVECAGCDAVVREGQPEFADLWEVASWP